MPRGSLSSLLSKGACFGISKPTSVYLLKVLLHPLLKRGSSPLTSQGCSILARFPQKATYTLTFDAL